MARTDFQKALRSILALLLIGYWTTGAALAQTYGQDLAREFPNTIVVVRKSEPTAPIAHLLTATQIPSDIQSIRQNFQNADIAVADIQLLNLAELVNDLNTVGTALVVNSADLSNDLLNGIFTPGIRFYQFVNAMTLSKSSVRRPDGTVLTQDGNPRILDRSNTLILVTAGDPRLDNDMLLYPTGTSQAQLRQIMELAGLDFRETRPFDSISAALLADPSTALLTGDGMFLDPTGDAVLAYAANMNIYHLDTGLRLDEITPAGLAIPQEDNLSENDGVAQMPVLPQNEADDEPVTPGTSNPEEGLTNDTVVDETPNGPSLVAGQFDMPIDAVGAALDDGYIHVQGGLRDQILLRPGFCDTGTVDMLIVQYQTPPANEWQNFTGGIRSALLETSRWDQQNCADDRALQVRAGLVFEGVLYSHLNVLVTDARVIGPASFEEIAPVPPETVFSKAVADIEVGPSLEMEVTLPDNWTLGSPPGISDARDPRYQHALYIEGVFAKETIYDWTPESLATFENASLLGSQMATDQILRAADFKNIAPRVFFNLSQGRPAVSDDVAEIMRSHGGVFQRAIEQRIGYYVYLDQEYTDFNVSIKDGLIELDPNAPPNHYDITKAMNEAVGRDSNILSSAYLSTMNLSNEAGWECDGQKCYAFNGITSFKLVARRTGIACTSMVAMRTNCDYLMSANYAMHMGLENTVQGRFFDSIVQAPGAQPFPANATFERVGSDWQLVGSILIDR